MKNTRVYTKSSHTVRRLPPNFAEMFAEAKVNGEELCYVSDEFTPASFVSQAGQFLRLVFAQPHIPTPLAPDGRIK